MFCLITSFNENIKYLISSRGNRMHNQSCLQSHLCATAPRLAFFVGTKKLKSKRYKLSIHTDFGPAFIVLSTYVDQRNLRKVLTKKQKDKNKRKETKKKKVLYAIVAHIKNMSKISNSNFNSNVIVIFVQN